MTYYAGDEYYSDDHLGDDPEWVDCLCEEQKTQQAEKGVADMLIAHARAEEHDPGRADAARPPGQRAVYPDPRALTSRSGNS